MKKVIRVGKGKVAARKTAGKKIASKRKKDKITIFQGKEMVSVRIDHKTVIFVPKGTNKEKAKTDFIGNWTRDQGTLAHPKEK
jgi:hypothetical protein